MRNLAAAEPIRVMIVEDNPDVARLASLILQGEQHEVRVTPSGKQAVLLVNEWHPDLVLLDLGLEELAGDVALTAIRDFSSVPVIVSTAESISPKELLASGATAILPKPWMPDQLATIVRRFAGTYDSTKRNKPAVSALLAEDLRRISSMTPDELDRLPFGVIKIDAQGIVRSFNKYEQESSGLETRQVVGRNFFGEIAPCAAVQRFHGVFREGAARGCLNKVFRFVFPTHEILSTVTIRIYYDPVHSEGWIFVSRLT